MVPAAENRTVPTKFDRSVVQHDRGDFDARRGITAGDVVVGIQNLMARSVRQHCSS